MLTLVALFACSDPELAPIADALSRWDEARAAQEGGDLSRALSHVRDARRLDPTSPALAGWEADILRQQGARKEALLVLDAALLGVPDHAGLRQQRAWLRMVEGDRTGAAEDLAPLVRAGLVDPEVLAEDPVYRAFADDPTTAWLVPRPRVEATVSAESGAVLVGETWVLDMEVDLRAGQTLAVERVGDSSAAPLRLERVIDDRLGSDGRREQRRLTWVFRATGPTETTFGPWTLRTEDASLQIGPVPVEVTALGARQSAGEPWVPSSLPVPLSLAGADAPMEPRRVEALTVLPAPPGAEIALEAAPDPGVVDAEARVGGQPRWSGPVLPAGSGARATVVNGAWTLFEGTMP